MLILIKYLFYFAILGLIAYIVKTIFGKDKPTPPSQPPKKLNAGDQYWLDLEERAEQRAKKYNDNDFV